jgi:hypothetical protein
MVVLAGVAGFLFAALKFNGIVVGYGNVSYWWYDLSEPRGEAL